MSNPTWCNFLPGVGGLARLFLHARIQVAQCWALRVFDRNFLSVKLFQQLISDVSVDRNCNTRKGIAVLEYTKK